MLPRRVGRGLNPLLSLRRLMLDCLLLRGLLLGVLFCQVPADQTSTHCTDDSVVTRIVAGHSTHCRALEATGRVSGSDRRCGQNGGHDNGDHRPMHHPLGTQACFHSRPQSW